VVSAKVGHPCLRSKEELDLASNAGISLSGEGDDHGLHLRNGVETKLATTHGWSLVG